MSNCSWLGFGFGCVAAREDLLPVTDPSERSRAQRSGLPGRFASRLGGGADKSEGSSIFMTGASCLRGAQASRAPARRQVRYGILLMLTARNATS